MTTFLVTQPILFVFAIFIAASTNTADLDFTVSIQGIEERNVIEEGLKPAELTTLMIKSKNANVSVSEFKIFHARGKSPINGANVKGDSFDISQYRAQAKSGDRIVIEITVVTESGNRTTMEDKIIQIPIK